MGTGIGTGVVELTQQLLRIPSITPDGILCFQTLASILGVLGFTEYNLDQGDTQNRYYKRGEGQAKVCFVGHVDVVPVGDSAKWTHPPFSGDNHQGVIYGRGAVDMKGSLAAFIAALENLGHTTYPVAILLTSDEEGDAYRGIVTTLNWLKEKNEVPVLFLGGEPTSKQAIGDTLKVGRRGSFHATFTLNGTQGHVAYPHKAHNPARPLGDLISHINQLNLDDGDNVFQPSHAEIIAVDMPFVASNVTPASATLKLNIRFNPAHDAMSLQRILEDSWQQVNQKYGEHYKGAWTFSCTSLPFKAKPWAGLDAFLKDIETITGKKPLLSTDGGTSDARHVQALAPVIELGLKNDLAHKVDECVPVKDLEKLTLIYEKLLISMAKSS